MTATAGVLAALFGLHVLLLYGAASPSLAAVVVACAGLWAIEVAVQRSTDVRLRRTLTRMQAGERFRSLLRVLLVAAFVLQGTSLNENGRRWVIVALGVQQACWLLFAGLVAYLSVRRRRRAETRNIGGPATVLPAAPSELLLKQGLRVGLYSDALLVAGAVASAASDDRGWVTAGAVATVVVALLPVLVLLPHALRVRGILRGVDQYRAVADTVRELEPLVVLYFSGGARDTYQIDTWLSTLEKLDRKVLVLLRERAVFEALAPTTLPVLCLTTAADVLNLVLPSARVSLFAANVGKNIHLLREPDLMSVFIGHGDSDKTASFNPFSKVYDEVWVAGEAGRDRYRRADVGVRDEQVVVVGRPQLDGLQQSERDVSETLTVLYAPTWEGWTEDPHHSSIVTMGREIVRVLLSTSGVRVLFKPHPRTGSVDPEAARAQADIEGMLAAAGAPHEVVLPDGLSLYDCFDVSGALVSDVSSVVSDFLASQKPYFVANGAALPDAEFRETYSSAAAAYLIGPGAAGLQEGLADLRGPDTRREDRARVRTYLLGSPEVPSLTRFRDAVDTLAAGARRGHTHGTSAPDGAADEAAEVPIGGGT